MTLEQSYKRYKKLKNIGKNNYTGNLEALKREKNIFIQELGKLVNSNHQFTAKEEYWINEVANDTDDTDFNS